MEYGWFFDDGVVSCAECLLCELVVGMWWCGDEDGVGFSALEALPYVGVCCYVVCLELCFCEFVSFCELCVVDVADGGELEDVADLLECLDVLPVDYSESDDCDVVFHCGVMKLMMNGYTPSLLTSCSSSCRVWAAACVLPVVSCARCCAASAKMCPAWYPEFCACWCAFWA